MYWCTIVLWLTLIDQSEPVTEPYVRGEEAAARESGEW